MSYLNIGGTVRSRTAEETMAILEPMLLGYGITRVAHVTGLDCLGIPVSICFRPNSKDLSVSQGKGLTQLLADLSAVMESIEFYHAENLGPPDVTGSVAELKAHHRLVDPANLVPGPFPSMHDINWRRAWRRGWNLFTGEEILLPYAVLSLDTTQRRAELGSLQISSTGLAGGNCLEEALCHALYEIIERDSIARWVLRSPAERAETEIDISTVKGSNRTLLDAMESGGVETRIWELTSSVGVPTFRCTTRDVDKHRNLGVFGGAGAHLSRDVALSRALTEAAQSRLTIISGSRDDQLPSNYNRLRAARKIELRAKKGPKQDFNQGVAPELRGSFSEDLECLLERLRRCGYMTAAATVLSGEDNPFAFVRVLVPGMIDSHRL
jgi:YcaO-like protein with predicted kinase domain